jgi:hypothetical protein
VKGCAKLSLCLLCAIRLVLCPFTTSCARSQQPGGREELTNICARGLPGVGMSSSQIYRWGPNNNMKSQVHTPVHPAFTASTYILWSARNAGKGGFRCALGLLEGGRTTTTRSDSTTTAG